MLKKYTLTSETIHVSNKVLHRIRSSQEIRDIPAGIIGGFVESEGNLSQDGDSSVIDDAMVYDDAFVSGDAIVGNYARICDGAVVFGSAQVIGHAVISGESQVKEKAEVRGHVFVCDSAVVAGTNMGILLVRLCVLRGQLVQFMCQVQIFLLLLIVSGPVMFCYRFA